VIKYQNQTFLTFVSTTEVSWHHMESWHCLCSVNKKGIGGNSSGALQSTNLATKLSEQWAWTSTRVNLSTARPCIFHMKCTVLLISVCLLSASYQPTYMLQLPYQPDFDEICCWTPQLKSCLAFWFWFILVQITPVLYEAKIKFYWHSQKWLKV